MAGSIIHDSDWLQMREDLDRIERRLVKLNSCTRLLATCIRKEEDVPNWGRINFRSRITG